MSGNHSNMQGIPGDSSIFTAEAKAVDLALDFIIFSDSLSVLKAMNHTSSKKLLKNVLSFYRLKNCSLLDS